MPDVRDDVRAALEYFDQFVPGLGPDNEPWAITHGRVLASAVRELRRRFGQLSERSSLRILELENRVERAESALVALRAEHEELKAKWRGNCNAGIEAELRATIAALRAENERLQVEVAKREDADYATYP